MINSSCEIIHKAALAPGVHDIRVLAPDIARSARPGQFAHIKCEGFTLRRPISICESDPESGTLRFVLEERGKGTRALGALRKCEYLDIIAPIGNGFALLPDDKRAVLVGGGIGAPPLLGLARHYGERALVLLGFGCAASVILREDFERLGCEVRIATDDGSAGHHGYVTALLPAALDDIAPDIIYACGPQSMNKAVALAAREHGVRCQLSLEGRMGCGVGGCLVCVCKTHKDGVQAYSRVCVDGPVFESWEVFPNG